MKNNVTSFLRPFLFACTMLLAQGLFAQTTYTFTAGFPGSPWTDQTKWTSTGSPPHYPGTTIAAGDVAVINGAFSICTINTGVTIEGTLTGNIPIQVNSGKTLTIADGGLFTCNLNTAIEGVLEIQFGGTFNNEASTDIEDGGILTYSGTLNNNGALDLNTGGELILNADPATWPGGNFNWKNGSTVSIGANGDLISEVPLTVASGRTLQVNGTFTVKTSSGTLTNDGTIDINSSGKLQVNNGCNLTNNAGGIVNIDGPLRINSNSTLTNTGTIDMNGGLLFINSPNAIWPGGTFNWNSGTVRVSGNGDVDISVSEAVPVGGELEVVGSLTVNSGVSLTNDGSLTNEGNLGLNGTLTNNGSLTNDIGVLNLNGGGDLILDTDPATLPGGTFNWKDGSTLTIGSSGQMNLTGSLSVESGRTLQIDGTLTNLGILDVENNGIVVVNDILNNDNGDLNLISGSELVLNANPATFPSGNFNWNPGATVRIGFSSTVNLNNSLTIPTGCTLQVDGNLTVTSNDTLTITGTLNNDGILNLNDGADLVLNSSPAFLPPIGTGTFNWGNGSDVTIGSGGDLTLSSSLTVDSESTLWVYGTVNIASGGTLSIDGYLSNRNGGTLTLEDGGALTNNGPYPDGGRISNYGTLIIENNGVLTNNGSMTNLTGGTLENSGNINHIDGYLSNAPNATFTITNSGILDIRDYTAVFKKLTNNGIVNLNSGGNYNLFTIHFSFPWGDFNWNDGSTITVGGNTVWFQDSPLTIESGRTLHVNQGGLLYMDSGTDHLTIDGTLENEGDVTAYGDLTNNGTLDNNGEVNSVGNLTNDGTLENNDEITAASDLTNNGTLDNNGKLSIYNDLTNNGILNLNSESELVLYAEPAAWPGGTFNWNNNSKLTIGSGGNLTLSDPLNIESGRTLKVIGTLVTNNALINEGTLTLNAGGVLVLNANPSTWPDTGGGIFNWNNSSTLFIGSSGTLALSSPLDIESGRTLRVKGILTYNSTLTNEGVLFLTSGGELVLNANLSTWPGGTFTWQNNSMVTIGANGNLTLSDPLTVNNGRTLNVRGALINEEILTINGTMTVIGTFTNNNTMGGSGNFNGNHINTNTVSPGTSPGCFTFNDDFTNSGTLEIELADGGACTNFDQIIVNGDATIGGTINISFPSGVPSTSTFTILTATGIKTVISPTIIWPTGYSGTGAFVGNEYQVSFALLPVELVYFQADLLDDNAVELKWQTASEQNNRGFEIQRSNDGSDWGNIGFVEGAGTTLEEQHYSYSDQPNSSGLFYYRLRQMDFDGGSEFSTVRSVELRNTKSELKIFPNPAISYIHINMENDWEGELTLRIVNTLGQEVFFENIYKSNSTANWLLNMSDISQGIYQLIISDGKRVMVESVVRR